VSAGWLIADASAGDFSHSIGFITDYSLFGAVWLAFIVGTVTQQALQDGNYYIGINALQNLFGGIREWRRLYSCIIAVVAATFFTWLLRQSPDAWVTFLQFIAATVPSATVISITDHFLVPRVFRLSRPLTRVPSWEQAGAVNVPAVVALACAVFVGVAGNGHFPWCGLEGRFWYLPTSLAWLTALGLYMAGVALVRGRPDASGGSVTPSRGATPSTGAWSTATSRSTSPPAGAGAVRIVRHRPPARRPGAPCGALYGS
jgi:purine-cytosine permease-like protein